MGLGNIFRNLRSRGLKDVTNPKVWRTMAEWQEIKANGLTLPAEDIRDYVEIVAERMALCQPCVDAGECVHCHCEMPQKAFVPVAECSKELWGPMDIEKHRKDRENGVKKEIIVITRQQQ